jgi:hypothetical protein
MRQLGEAGVVWAWYPFADIGHLGLDDAEQLAWVERDGVAVIARAAENAVVVEQPDVDDLGRGQQGAERG